MRGEVTKCFAYGVDEALGDLDRTGRNDVIDAGAKAWLVSLACQFPEDVPEGPEQDRWTISALTDYVQRHCAAAGYASLENVLFGLFDVLFVYLEALENGLSLLLLAFLTHRRPYVHVEYVRALYGRIYV